MLCRNCSEHTGLYFKEVKNKSHHVRTLVDICGLGPVARLHKANIDYKIGGYLVPEKVKFEWKESDYHD